MVRLIVKSKSHHDAAPTSTNVTSKYQLPTPYSFPDTARARFFRAAYPPARLWVKTMLHSLQRMWGKN